MSCRGSRDTRNMQICRCRYLFIFAVKESPSFVSGDGEKEKQFCPRPLYRVFLAGRACSQMRFYNLFSPGAQDIVFVQRGNVPDQVAVIIHIRISPVIGYAECVFLGKRELSRSFQT